MRDLERELAALEVEWPPTPDLAALVAPRLTPRARRAWLKRGLAVLVLLVGGGLAVSPAARSALGDLLGLHGDQVRRGPLPPAPSPHPGRLGSGLGLGRAVTLVEARARAGFRLTLPPGLGAPDAVWLAAPGRVSVTYGRRPGIPVSPHTNVAVLVTEFRGRVTPVIGKLLATGTHVTRIAVPAGRAYAITGEPHSFVWIAPNGEVSSEDRRLAGTTLLVERRDGVLVRVEGELPLARLRRLADQLRP